MWPMHDPMTPYYWHPTALPWFNYNPYLPTHSIPTVTHIPAPPPSQSPSLPPQPQQNQAPSSTMTPPLRPIPTNRPVQPKKGSHRTREWEDNFERKKQKKNRNLPSNVLKHFIHYLYHHPAFHPTPDTSDSLAKLRPQLLQLVRRMNEVITEEQNYIRPLKMQGLLQGSELPSEERALLRVELRRFMVIELPGIVACLPRLRRQQKRDMMKVGRNLFRDLCSRQFK